MAAYFMSHTMRRSSGHNCAAAVRRVLSSDATSPSVFSRILLKLSHYYYDVESILGWKYRFRRDMVSRQNKFFVYAHSNFGANIGAAYFILKMRGGFRFAGHSEWVRPDIRGRFSHEFMNHPHLHIEEVDLSGSLINYDGLDNFIKQKNLKTLCLRACPEVDDWFLTRLHVFGESLEELDLSNCPRVTVGGLAALQNLRKLQRLYISTLPRLESPGLVRILLEEMLPHCQVTGVEYEQGLIQQNIQQPTDGDNVASTNSGLQHL